jgi:hypothetical protein
MTCGSSMLATVPSIPRLAQLSISMPKTRFRRMAQFIATCGGIGGLAGSTA